MDLGSRTGIASLDLGEKGEKWVVQWLSHPHHRLTDSRLFKLFFWTCWVTFYWRFRTWTTSPWFLFSYHHYSTSFELANKFKSGGVMTVWSASWLSWSALSFWATRNRLAGHIAFVCLEYARRKMINNWVVVVVHERAGVSTMNVPRKRGNKEQHGVSFVCWGGWGVMSLECNVDEE